MQPLAGSGGPFDPGESKPGPPAQQPSISKRVANEAWADLARNLDIVEELTAEIAQAHATQEWAVVGALVKQQQRLFDKNLKRPRAILDQVHPKPNSPQQQTDGN